MPNIYSDSVCIQIKSLCGICHTCFSTRQSISDVFRWTGTVEATWSVDAGSKVTTTSIVYCTFVYIYSSSHQEVIDIGVGAQSTLGVGTQNFCPKNMY